jgi:hypothetical protein
MNLHDHGVPQAICINGGIDERTQGMSGVQMICAIEIAFIAVGPDERPGRACCQSVRTASAARRQ